MSWRRTAFYGTLLAVGTLALQWLDYQRLARAHAGDIYVFLIAILFLGLGIYLGARVVGAREAGAFDGNPKAQATPRHQRRASSWCSGTRRRPLQQGDRGPAQGLAEHRQDARGAAVRQTGREAAHGRDQPGTRTRDRALSGRHSG